ncbi:MAG TPA: type II secretion system F family protein [Candidatus Deferrimicrobium sp.]|nr:type II secretion system F family protein [Candidatus Deferrimicrobium sp.]
MPYYNCTFLDDNGRHIKKTIFADNKDEVWRNNLNADEKLISIRKSYLKDSSTLKLFARKISYFDFLAFNQKMITLLKSGVAFIRAMEIIIANQKKGNLKEVLLKTEANIRNGIQISDAFASEQIPFQRIYRASLLAGEKSGNIDSILGQFNSYLEKIANLKRKIINSLTYPVLLFVFMIGMVSLILVYVIPKFATFYADFESDLPATTLALVALGQFMKKHLLTIVAAIVGLIMGLKFLEKSNPRIIIFDYLKIKLPFVGKIIIENSMTVFSRTMAILISGGIPVPEATQIAVRTFSNKYFFSKIKDIPVKIKEGNLLSDVLKDVDFIPPTLVEVIKVGETSGNLAGVLNENANAFENSIDARINTLISLIEPFLIVVMGGVIAFMLVAVYLPIFSTVHIVK